MKLALPDSVREALARLNAAGHEAWLVGGVRDLCLKRVPNDYDITTSATPDKIKEVFGDCKLNLMGEKFGTVCVHLQDSYLDITTFRKEGGYLDHRHPDTVRFTKNLFDDLKRRDFTVNAIVYHPERGFRDYFCGMRDLKKKLIRAIGDADRRFEEDAVRILRALRFAAVLGFSIEEKTREAIFRKKELLTTIAPERALPEIRRMLCGRNIRPVLTEYAEVLGVLIPEILPCIGFDQKSPFHRYDVWQHTVHAVHYADPDPILRLTLLFHDISKPTCLSVDATGRGHFYSHPKKSAAMAKTVMQRMKFPTKEIETVTLLVSLHDSHPANDADVKLLLNSLGEELFPKLLRVMRADTLAHSRWTVPKRLELLEKLRESAQRILRSGACYNLKTLAINGNDLEEIGISGVKVGEALHLALQNVIRGEWINKKENLLEEIKKIYS